MPGESEQQQQGEQGQGGQQKPPAPTFDEWLAGQPEEVRGIVTEGTRGLKSALDAEREQRKAFERQLREAAGKVEQGSEARKKLDELSGQLEAQGRQAEFYEAAHAAGVTNLKLAWLVVQQDGLMDKQGRVNWQAFAQAYPELIRKQAAPAGNAGAGTQNPPPSGVGMNAFIRKAAGRGG